MNSFVLMLVFMAIHSQICVFYESVLFSIIPVFIFKLSTHKRENIPVGGDNFF